MPASAAPRRWLWYLELAVISFTIANSISTKSAKVHANFIVAAFAGSICIIITAQRYTAHIWLPGMTYYLILYLELALAFPGSCSAASAFGEGVTRGTSTAYVGVLHCVSQVR